MVAEQKHMLSKSLKVVGVSLEKCGMQLVYVQIVYFYPYFNRQEVSVN